jgi:hypothetical protein
MSTLTLLHVAISLVGILTGFVVAFGLLADKRLERWTAAFLISTTLTSLTGFLFFPLRPFLPSHVTGVISLVFLAAALYARYARGLAGGWRRCYVTTAVISLYLNVFVLVVQLFLKVPALHVLAPTQAEPPFAIAQGIVLLAFIVLGSLAARRFRGGSARLAGGTS